MLYFGGMKRFVISLILIGTSLFVFAQGNAKLTIEWNYINVIEGYDHESKSAFYLNGEQIGESDISKNSEINYYTMLVPSGVQSISMQNWSLYEGTWEEVLKENNYSVDAFYTVNLNFTAGEEKKIKVQFDIDSEKVITVSID